MLLVVMLCLAHKIPERLGSADDNNLCSVATLSTERKLEHGFLFEGPDRWAELLSDVDNDLRLLVRDESKGIRADGYPQQATFSARARVYALPLVDSEAA